jgi:hypothetical protein
LPLSKPRISARDRLDVEGFRGIYIFRPIQPIPELIFQGIRGMLRKQETFPAAVVVKIPI